MSIFYETFCILLVVTWYYVVIFLKMSCLFSSVRLVSVLQSADHFYLNTYLSNNSKGVACSYYWLLCHMLHHAKAEIQPLNHITSTLHDDLHWLPILQRISYKLYTIVYKSIHGQLHLYLTNFCVPVATNTNRHYLRLATHGDLLMPRMRTVTYGPRSFAVSGLTIWNTLPSTLRVSATTLGQFQSGLKTILFHLAYGTWLGAFMTV